jgi:type IV secretion system protein VirD4
MLCGPNGKGLEDYWQKTSFALLTDLILHVLYTGKTGGETASLSDVARSLSDAKPDRRRSRRGAMRRSARA